MKINSNYVVKNIVGDTVIIPTGEAAQYFNGLINTNEVAAFIWQNIETCNTPEEMVEKVLNEFNVDEETAKNDTLGFLETLKQVGMIEY